MIRKIKETGRKLFTGGITLQKRELWMIGILCVLAGVVYGLRKAPWTHGVSIGSYNGNHKGCDGCSEDCCEEGCECGCDEDCCG